MSDSTRTPDALYVPQSAIHGSDLYDRAENLTALARKLLDMPDGPAPVISPREQAGDQMLYFVRRSLADTKLFPKNHDRAGEVRHDWVDGPDGIRLGYSKGD